jgi:hypothetical protein
MYNVVYYYQYNCFGQLIPNCVKVDSLSDIKHPFLFSENINTGMRYYPALF